jgi:Na+/H+-dicarboxylate symporter
MTGTSANQAVPPRRSGYRPHAIIASIVLGALVGGFLPAVGVAVKILGDLFMNALMMLVVPLVMASIIVGISNLGDIRRLGSLGRRTIIYYLMTTSISVILGLILVNAIRPGAGVHHGEQLPDVGYRIDGSIDGSRVTLDGSLSRTNYGEGFVITLEDQDITGRITSCTSGTVTVAAWRDAEGQEVEPEAHGVGIAVELGVVEGLAEKPSDAGSVLGEVVRNLIPRSIFQAMSEGQILPLIFFSLLLGAVLTTLGERGEPALAFFRSLNDAVMGLVHWVMAVAPVGIFGLIAGRIGGAGGFEGFVPELIALGKYFVTVVSGLAIHGLVILPLLLLLLGKRRPLEYARNTATALLNAFSTASSSATLPLTMTGVVERNRVSAKTASFVLPLGATINMDGTALYEAVAAMFIAQVYGIDLGLGPMVIIFLTATLASIGAAGIPEAGLVTMLIVLNAVNLPTEGVALILTIDWLLDRFRTTVNVWGDAVGAGVIETQEGGSGLSPQ